jgi:hypothetical protein
MGISDFFSNGSDDNQKLLDFESFKNREIKAKKIFKIREISKPIAYNFISEYHYLGKAKFFSMFSYGLFYDMELVGVATFSSPQGNVALKGWFGLNNDDMSVLELSRLCLLPELNGTNATSFLLGNSMKLLKRIHSIRAVITLADDSRHVGSIYQVCNFNYYGLSTPKSDFFRASDGKVNPRGETKNTNGVWIARTRKHRYCYILDKNLKCLLGVVGESPSLDKTSVYTCCNGEGTVDDNRFKKIYVCPKCSSEPNTRMDEVNTNGDIVKYEEENALGDWFG